MKLISYKLFHDYYISYGDVWSVIFAVTIVTADVVEIVRKLQLEAEPGDVPELLQSHGKTLWRVASYDGQREWFLGMESTAEDAMKITEKTTKDLEHYIDLVDKTAAGFERVDSNLNEALLWADIIACYRKITGERKSQLVRQTSLLSYLRHWHSHRNLQQPSLWSASSHQHQDKNLHQQKDHDSLKIMTYSDDDLHVLAIKYFLVKYVCFFTCNATVHYSINITLDYIIV